MPAKESLADRYFRAHFDTTLAALLAPINGESPAGCSLVGTPTYAAIRSLREMDDPSLPIGVWQSELKCADWPAIGKLCVQALSRQCKDLQIGAWLLEAGVHQHGFAALAPGLSLLSALCEIWWQQLFPPDPELRSNVFHRLADKLGRQVRLVPFTAGGDIGYSWCDWEQAQRDERIGVQTSVEGVTLASFSGALANTPAESILTAQESLTAALTALDQLAAEFVAKLGDDAPSLNFLYSQVENISRLLDWEIRRRTLSDQASHR